MAIINNKQYSQPWGSQIYKGTGETYTVGGCGPTSVSDIVGNRPNEVGDYLGSNGYSAYHSGTYWGGIPAGLQHFGVGAAQLNYSSLYGVISCSVFDAFRKQIQNGYCGVLLMGKGYWTNGGHYIAITGYDSETQKYRVYDPATTARDGYHAWGDFAGTIKVCYTTNERWKASPEPAFKPTGTATCTDNNVNIRAAAGMSSAILGTLNTGQRFEIDGKTANGYTHCNVAGIGVGWIATQYVKIDTPTPTPTPTPVTSGYKFKPGLVQLGSKGSHVTLFQTILKPLNIYTGTIDTVYGEGCVAACKKQQALRSLEQDGVCGSKTWHTMIEVPSVGDVYYAQTIQKGSSGASVKLAQQILKSFGYYTNAIDGVFGDGSYSAVVKWQKAHSLSADGIVGNATWRSLIGF